MAFPRRLGRFAAFGLALAAAVAPPLAPALAACEPSDRDALLILDASDSMLRYSGTAITRFNVAKKAIAAALELFPDDGQVGLRLYGSQEHVDRAVCTDSILAVPFAPAARNRGAITAALALARARGRTPIAYALEQAAADFPQNSTRTIILVSDGRESCFGDPCATAARLAGQGFVINTVGFQVDRLGRAQLECIANATGGAYFNAPAAVQLTNQLMQALGVCAVVENRVRPRWTDDDGSPALAAA
jgi:Ca-activated chloride channel family protein